MIKPKLKTSWHLKVLIFAALIIINSSVYPQITASFIHGGISRSYIVYTPESYVSGQSLPLLLCLHGLTQTGSGIMEFSDFNTIADTGNFIVAYPNGVGNAWNVGFTGGSTADDEGFLDALIDTLHHQFNIDLKRIYSTGFSNGGFMSYRLACELSNRIAAIAPVAGTMTLNALSQCTPSRSVPVLHIHGTSDYVVLYNGGYGNASVQQTIDYWNDFNYCPANAIIVNLPDLIPEGSTVTRYTWSPCNDEVAVELLKVNNGGHTWPGSVGVTGVGITNRDISASSEIWNFVKNFSLNEIYAVNNIFEKPVRLYPNPVMDGMLYFELGSDTAMPTCLQVVDAYGRLRLEKPLDANQYSIQLDVSSLTKGVYLVHFTGNKYNVVKRFVIQ